MTFKFLLDLRLENLQSFVWFDNEISKNDNAYRYISVHRGESVVSRKFRWLTIGTVTGWNVACIQSNPPKTDEGWC